MIKENKDSKTESEEEVTKTELADDKLKVQTLELFENKNIHSPNAVLIYMNTISKYINDVELERELEKVINNEYSLFEECQSCDGFRILHREGACLRKSLEEKDVIEREKEKIIIELALRMEG